MFAEGQAGQDAVRVNDGEALTYAALWEACACHAHFLREEGIRPGDRVGVKAHRRLDVIVALITHARIGVVSVPIDPKIGSGELAYITKNAELKHVLDHGVLKGHRRELGDPPASSKEVLVLYTSGTTGNPKGAVHTVEGIEKNLDALASAWKWGPGDTVVHALPISHIHGLVVGLFGSLRRGGTLHLLSPFRADHVADALERGGTMLFGVPRNYNRLAEAVETDRRIAAAARRARLLISGSAKLAQRDMERILKHCGKHVIERYGMTETGINCAVRCGEPQPGLVGPPLEGVEVRLVDLEDRTEVLHTYDDYTTGEIAVKGPSVSPGYVDGDGGLRRIVDDDGWFYTGDLAKRDATGALRHVGRKDRDLLKCGGYQVGAGEVEVCLATHPRVKRAAVVGLLHPTEDQTVAAFVVPEDALGLPRNPSSRKTLARELAKHVSRDLVPYKRPREVYFVTDLPEDELGKVQKNDIPETMGVRLLSNAGGVSRAPEFYDEYRLLAQLGCGCKAQAASLIRLSPFRNLRQHQGLLFEQRAKWLSFEHHRIRDARGNDRERTENAWDQKVTVEFVKYGNDGGATGQAFHSDAAVRVDVTRGLVWMSEERSENVKLKDEYISDYHEQTGAELRDMLLVPVRIEGGSTPFGVLKLLNTGDPDKLWRHHVGLAERCASELGEKWDGLLPRSGEFICLAFDVYDSTAIMVESGFRAGAQFMGLFMSALVEETKQLCEKKDVGPYVSDFTGDGAIVMVPVHPRDHARKSVARLIEAAQEGWERACGNPFYREQLAEVGITLEPLKVALTSGEAHRCRFGDGNSTVGRPLFEAARILQQSEVFERDVSPEGPVIRVSESAARLLELTIDEKASGSYLCDLKGFPGKRRIFPATLKSIKTTAHSR